MKKLAIFAFAALITISVSAQKDSVKRQQELPKLEKVEVVRDRLIFDIYHTFWMGTPDAGDFAKFDPGFNVSALWDFKIPQSKSISFGLGLGFTYYTQYSNCLLQYDANSDINRYMIIPKEVKFKRSRTAYMNCNIPIEMRYRHKSGFKFDFGVHVGLVAGLSHNYKGDNYNGEENDYLNFKNRNFYHKEKFSADVFFRTGWKSFGVYYSYQLTNVFKEGKGAKMHPMSVGISISLF